MPRPIKPRYVQGHPVADKFLPNRTPAESGQEVFLSVEGLEAIRLNDFEGLDQEKAAEKMNVSRQTFGRILSQARSVIAEALVLGKILRIEGGNFAMSHKGRRRRRSGWR